MLGPSSSQRKIGRVKIEVLPRDAAIELIRAAFKSGRPRLIGFCNAHTVNLAARNDEFATALQSFTILNDGVGVDVASRVLYGEAFPTNLVGTDFVPDLLEATSSLRVFLLGSATAVSERALAVLQERYKQHNFVGAHHGFFAASEDETVVAKIRKAAPDLILVGMGQPRQEVWSQDNLCDIPAVTMCVGALLEFSAGSVPRAPSWVRTARLEWAYRLVLEPRRLGKRYLIGNFEFIARVLRDRASQRL